MKGKKLQFSKIREKITTKQSPRRIWSKTMLIMVLMVLLTLISVFVLFRFSAGSMENHLSSSLQQSVQQRKLNMDFRLRSLSQTAEDLISMIYPYMSVGGDRGEQLQEFAELNSILSAYTGNENISSVRLFVPESKIYSNQGGTFYSMSVLENDPDAEWMPYLHNSGLSWIETRSVSMIDSARGILVPKDVLTCAYSMRLRSNYDRMACVLMLDVEVADFNELLGTDEPDSQFGYLVNGEGKCLASPDRTRLLQNVIDAGLMEQIRQNESGCLKKSRRIYVYQKLEANDWYIVMDYPASVLSVLNSTQGSLLQVMVVVVLAVVLTLVFILAYNFTVNITLARINTSLDALNTGQDSQLEEKPEFLDPLHRLERNADQMVLTVKDLMEERYRDQIAIAESQMKSLQAQIKPHFLYNTLDTIKWMILGQKTEDAAWMVNALSRYLRQSINKGPSIIPLREELELSRTYLEIMQKRFENRFTVNFEIEDAAADYMIPKLSLQPLLENALLHGILYCEKPEKELTVRAWAGRDSVHIEVEDNGNGMPEETRQKLEKGSIGYGLTNVRKRLSLFGMEKSEFQIFSREGVGTCIAIRIPAVQPEQAKQTT